jgi:hypothetical protein
VSAFWGYPYADLLALAVIGGLSAACLLCARLYVKAH